MSQWRPPSSPPSLRPVTTLYLRSLRLHTSCLRLEPKQGTSTKFGRVCGEPPARPRRRYVRPRQLACCERSVSAATLVHCCPLPARFEVLSTPCCGEHLERLKTKPKWFTQVTKGENYNSGRRRDSRTERRDQLQPRRRLEKGRGPFEIGILPLDSESYRQRASIPIRQTRTKLMGGLQVWIGGHSRLLYTTIASIQNGEYLSGFRGCDLRISMSGFRYLHY